MRILAPPRGVSLSPFPIRTQGREALALASGPCHAFRRRRDKAIAALALDFASTGLTRRRVHRHVFERALALSLSLSLSSVSTARKEKAKAHPPRGNEKSSERTKDKRATPLRSLLSPSLSDLQCSSWFTFPRVRPVRPLL